MNERAVSSLIDEVNEYLGAGSVGLYEFIWFLRSDSPDLTEAELVAHAEAGLEHVLKQGNVRLVWQLWNDGDFREDAVGVVPTQADWNDPTGKPYLAVVRK